MSVFVTKDFSKFAKKARLTDAKLLQAARDVSAGLYDADLGGGVFKQRISREGRGKSGGYRAIIFFRVASHCFFAYGFSKSDQANGQGAASAEKTGARFIDLFARGARRGESQRRPDRGSG